MIECVIFADGENLGVIKGESVSYLENTIRNFYPESSIKIYKYDIEKQEGLGEFILASTP
jgi:hypothetical protein